MDRRTERAHRIRSAGFTLIELVLAVALVGGSFMSLLFLRTSAVEKAGRFNMERRVQRLAQEKLDEIVYGLETATAGEFEEEPDWTWEAEIFSLATTDTLHPLLQASLVVFWTIDLNDDGEEYTLDTRFFVDAEHPLFEYATFDTEEGF